MDGLTSVGVITFIKEGLGFFDFVVTTELFFVIIAVTLCTPIESIN